MRTEMMWLNSADSLSSLMMWLNSADSNSSVMTLLNSTDSNNSLMALLNSTDSNSSVMSRGSQSGTGTGYNALQIIMFTNHATCGVISSLGIVCNILSAMVFYRQGFKDTVNISLLALAVSDVMSLLTSLWVSVCWNPLMYYADLPFIPADVEYLTGSIPHLVFTRITGWITAFVALERCLCVSLPPRVKTIMTPRRVTWLMVAIFTLVAAAHSTSFYTSSLDIVFDAARNRTLVGLVARPRSDELDSVSYSVNLVSPFGSFVVVLVCTVVTSGQLRQKSEWRAKAASTLRISSKDQKIVKMVVVMSVIFIVSYLPTNVMHVMYCVIADDQRLLAAYWDDMSVIFSFIKVLEAVNGSVSIVLYYTMSSRYRAGLRALLPACGQCTGPGCGGYGRPVGHAQGRMDYRR